MHLHSTLYSVTSHGYSLDSALVGVFIPKTQVRYKSGLIYYFVDCLHQGLIMGQIQPDYFCK